MNQTLTEPQKRVVEALRAAGKPLTVGEIAEAISVGYSWASRVIDQLVAAGVTKKQTRPGEGNGKFREVSLIHQPQTPAA